MHVKKYLYTEVNNDKTASIHYKYVLILPEALQI